jgi:DeoR/GlpR family transcriptional regulator of sugar metabolism
MPRVALEVVEDRRRRLAALLETAGYLPVDELCRRLNVSQATCRRDLSQLVDRAQIRRTFGGALGLQQPLGVRQYDASFASFRSRKRLASGSKLKLARRAVRMMKANQVVFIDAGTTTFRLVEELADQPPTPLTIVTHSLMVALHLGAVEGFTVHLLGGEVLHRQGLTLGKSTEMAAGDFEFDLALLGAEAFNSAGIFNSQENVVRLQKIVMERSKSTRFLMDRTKAGQSAPVPVLNWERWPGGDVRLMSDVDAATLSEQHIEKRFVIRV